MAAVSKLEAFQNETLGQIVDHWKDLGFRDTKDLETLGKALDAMVEGGFDPTFAKNLYSAAALQNVIFVRPKIDPSGQNVLSLQE